MVERSYTIDYQRYDGYLRAHVYGPSDSIEISVAYWREVAAECRRLGYSRLLVREELSGPGPLHEYYLVACEISRIVAGLRVAFVDTVHEELEANRLGETVASNRGADARMFADEESAIAWIAAD